MPHDQDMSTFQTVVLAGAVCLRTLLRPFDHLQQKRRRNDSLIRKLDTLNRIIPRFCNVAENPKATLSLRNMCI